MRGWSAGPSFPRENPHKMFDPGCWKGRCGKAKRSFPEEPNRIGSRHDGAEE